MIETLKPPTDSLYKFLAIIGLVIFLASLITPLTLMHQLKTEYAEFLRVADANNLDATTWEETWKQVEKNSARLLAINQSFIKSVDSNAPLSEQRRLLEEAKAADKIYDESQAKFLKELNDWRKQNVEVTYKKNILENTKDYVRDMYNVCTIAAPIGLIMSIFGFVLWYRRAQRYED